MSGLLKEARICRGHALGHGAVAQQRFTRQHFTTRSRRGIRPRRRHDDVHAEREPAALLLVPLPAYVRGIALIGNAGDLAVLKSKLVSGL